MITKDQMRRETIVTKQQDFTLKFKEVDRILSECVRRTDIIDMRTKLAVLPSADEFA